MQLRLTFRDSPAPESRVWDRVDDAHRTLAIEALAQLLAKAVVAPAAEEQADD